MKKMNLLIICLLSCGGCWVNHVHHIHPQYCAPASHENLLIIREIGWGTLFAVDKQQKNIEWKKQFDDGMVRSRPVSENGIVYFWVGVDSRARVLAMDCSTCDILWETAVNGDSCFPVMITDSEILFQSEQRHQQVLYAFSKETGELLWKQPDRQIFSVYNDEVLVLNPLTDRIELLNVSTGEPDYGFPIEILRFKRHDPRADINQEGVAVIGCENTLVALDIPKRKILWLQEDHLQYWFPSIRGDDLYLTSRYVSKKKKQDYRLQLRSLKDGRLINETELMHDRHSYSPILFFNDVIVVSYHKVITGYQKTTLKKLWCLEDIDYWDVSSVDGKLYVGGGTHAVDEPFLWELDPLTGEKVWVFEKKSRSIR